MPTYIAIDGHGGAGKTVLSKQLAAQLGAQLFHLDDYGDDYKPFIGIPALIDELKMATDDIVIYEGVGVFDERFDGFEPFRIMVHPPKAVSAERGLRRDLNNHSRTEEEWRKIWQIWEVAETQHFTEATFAKAHYTVGEHGEHELDAIIVAFKNFARKQLIKS